MIIDSFKKISIYKNSSISITKAFNFIKNSDLLNIKVGDYEIVGEDIFAKVREYETRAIQDNNCEAHKKYIDLHYTVSGMEYIGYTFTNSLQEVDYIKVKDQIILEGSDDFLQLKKDCFSIISPHEAHMPAVYLKEPEHVKKIIIKIKYE